MRHASYFGHPGNRGDAVLWGGELGAKLEHMSGYLGHGSVAHPHGILISWAVIMQGGFQVNRNGERFSDENLGYSEQAAIVLAQPDGIAFDIFDERIAAIARQFADFRQAEASGAIIDAPTLALLAARLNVPPPELAQSFAEIEEAKRTGGPDRFGRNFVGAAPLAPPFEAVKVTGALFHTQGGLAVDREARFSIPTANRCRTSLPPAAPPRAFPARARTAICRGTASDRNCAWPRRWAGRRGFSEAKHAGERLDEAHRRKKPNRSSHQSSLPRRLLNRALPSPVPIVSTPQCSTSSIKGRSLKPCTTASLCMMMTVS